MIKIEFYIDVEFAHDRSRLSVENVQKALTTTEAMLIEEYDGFTAVNCVGKYRDFPVADTVVYTCFVFATTEEDAVFYAAGVAKGLAILWQQESVLFTAQTVGGGLAFAKSGQI